MSFTTLAFATTSSRRSAAGRRTCPCPWCCWRPTAPSRSGASPVHSVPGSTSLTRASIFGSRSPKDSATGSIRSQYVRGTGNSAFAFATSPALHRGDELGGLLLQRDRLRVHVPLVARGRLQELGVGVDLRGRVTGHGEGRRGCRRRPCPACRPPGTCRSAARRSGRASGPGRCSRPRRSTRSPSAYT